MMFHVGCKHTLACMIVIKTFYLIVCDQVTRFFSAQKFCHYITYIMIALTVIHTTVCLLVCIEIT